MPRILRIINRFNLGGITYNVSYLSRFLPAEYETMLIGGPEEETEESSLFIPHSMGLEPLLIPQMKRSINPFSDFFAYLKIKKVIKEFSPHIVHTHASKAGAIGRLAAISCNVPVIVHTFHGHVFSGYFGKYKTGLFKRIERYLSKRSDAIVAISDIQKQELTVKFQVSKSDRTFVIPLGFDLLRFSTDQEVKRRSFRERFAVKESELLIGIVGRLAPIKNHQLFVDAILNISRKSKRPFRAMLVGDGETRKEIENYIRSNASGEEQKLFIFAGWIKDVDIALAGIDLVCLTSKNEGTPVSLIEAQAAGKFIVSTNVGGIRDILHPQCGLLSEPDDAIGFRKNLLDAVDHFEIYSSNAHAAQKDVLDKFSYLRLCSDMDQLYKTLLKNKERLN